MLPNYMKSTKSSRIKKSGTARLAPDGYPIDRNMLVKYLEACRKSLMSLNILHENKISIKAEKSKIKPEKIQIKDKAKDFQQFYTIDELAEECLEKFEENCPDIWNNKESIYLEPSAGEGDLLMKLPEGRRVGVDIDPQPNSPEEIKKMDFFKTTRENLNIDKNASLTLIGNPPFNDIALKFFNHATKVLNPECIAWILPPSWLSRTRYRDKIDPYYHLIYVMNITCCYVHKNELLNIPTIFGIWRKRELRLQIQPIILSHPDFELIRGEQNKRGILEEEKNLENRKTHFWIRKYIKHENGKPMPPVYSNGNELMVSYDKLRTSTPLQKLMTCFCISCSPDKYDELYNFFNTFKWKEKIGQFESGRGRRDWELPGRVGITETTLYAAINDSDYLRPYTDTIDGKEIQIKNERSRIMRGVTGEDPVGIKEKYKNQGVKVKKGGKTKKLKRRMKRRNSRRRN